MTTTLPASEPCPALAWPVLAVDADLVAGLLVRGVVCLLVVGAAFVVDVLGAVVDGRFEVGVTVTVVVATGRDAVVGGGAAAVPDSSGGATTVIAVRRVLGGACGVVLDGDDAALPDAALLGGDQVPTAVPVATRAVSATGADAVLQAAVRVAASMPANRTARDTERERMAASLPASRDIVAAPRDGPTRALRWAG